TGRPPFDLPGVGAIISAHLREPPPAPSSLAPHLPPGIDEIVLRCMAKVPGDRFQAMPELQQACDAVLAQITGVGPLARASASMPSPLVNPSADRPIPVITPRSLSVPSPHRLAALRAPADRDLSMPEVAQTTLGSSAGQSLGGSPRRR